MPGGQGAPASPRAAGSAPDRAASGPAARPSPQPAAAAGRPESAAPRRGALRASVPRKLAEALSSQYGLVVFAAGLLLLLAWAVHAARVGRSDLLCFLTALMLLQLLWMLWYVGRSAAHRHLLRPKDAHAGARWLRGESPPPAGAARRPLPSAPAPLQLVWLPRLPTFFFFLEPGWPQGPLSLPGPPYAFQPKSHSRTNLLPSFLG